ncbi:DNA (cytosine-5-)-methyltransferase [Vallitalea guaymasensis]|uniref:DNA (cytosine-5-)-methyltransferase n=1 Tax=Vallitalea guaymasensis TaxID=1185412 RepID=UPI00235486DE|nr:DNA (cytosine-5-)-methyltransferase [Vallitalea guaymasensis]
MKNKVKFIDLFAGIGGLRLGFEQAFMELGFETECVLTSEIKPHAIKVLENNFTHKNLVGDVREVNSDDIEDFDFLLAGFPCQAFSTAGKQLGFLDTRGTLFFEVERILRDKQPYGFILENVEGLIKHDLEKKGDKIGRTLNTILRSLENIGYEVTWQLLDSKDFGVAQSRKRVIIVGTHNVKINLNNFNVRTCIFNDIMERGLPTIESHFTRCLLSHYKPEQLYGKAIKDKRGGKNNIHSWDIELKGSVSKEQKEVLELLFKQRRQKHWADKIGIKWMDGMPLTHEQIETFYSHPKLKELLDDLVDKGYLKFEHPKGIVKIQNEDDTFRECREPDLTKPKGYNIVAGKLSFEFTKIIDVNDITPTLVAMDVSKLGVVDDNKIRMLSIREGLRLFGYPEKYNMDILDSNEKSKAFDLLGNTVVVPVVKDVAIKVAEMYYKSIFNSVEVCNL